VEIGRILFTRNAPIAVVLEPYPAGLGGGLESNGHDQMASAWAFLQDGAAAFNGTIPFIVCSVIDERRTAYALGAALYLLKPLSPQQLVAELHRLLDAAEAPIDKE
jgi:hypothetical protein